MLTQSRISLEERTDLCEKEKRMWRTLIRVSSLNMSEGKVGFIIPGWNVHEVLYFNLNQLPEDLRKKTYPPYRFHCPANIGARKKEDLYLKIESYELS